MTQEKINGVFEKWQELEVIYSTSDDRLFIRPEEAVKHTQGLLDENTKPLDDKTILDWYRDEY